MLTSGQAAFRAILILSEREEVAAWAQQLPQYCGMCWFLVWGGISSDIMFTMSGTNAPG